MKKRNWAKVEAAVDKLEELIESIELPGDHPETLQSIERCVSTIVDADIATSKCADLRTATRKFYGDKSRRSRSASAIETAHNRMTASIFSIKSQVSMLKALALQ